MSDKERNKKQTTSPSRPGRRRTGSLYWRKSGWRARITVDVDGVAVQKSFDLETTDKQAARAKLKRLARKASTPEAEEAARPVTVSEYAEGWIERRKKLKVAAVEYEERYMERIWGPAIGHKPLADVTKADVQGVLDDCATGHILPRPRKEGQTVKPFSRQSVQHIRATIVRLFSSAYGDELITENKATRAQVPDMEAPEKARAILTDAEIGQLVAHPDVDAELKVLVLLSRTVGGLRAGDLNSLDWTAFGPEFATLTFVRRKTRKKRSAPETLVVSEQVRPFVKAWHERNGEPSAGPVFPVRRGKRAGDHKKASNMSYASRLRRELLKAGVTRHELHHETATTLPVDFHSTRRAYSTALARAGVNEQTAMLLTGHADSKVHRRYQDQMARREMPDSAIPRLSTEHAETLKRKRRLPSQTPSFLERETGFEPATPSLGSEVQEPIQADLAGSEKATISETTRSPANKAPRADSPCLNPQPKDRVSPGVFEVSAQGDPVADRLSLAIGRAAEAGEWEVVSQLTRELEARRRAHEAPNVAPLPDRRKPGSS